MKPKPQTEKEITARNYKGDVMIKYNFFIPGRLPGLNEIINEARTNKYASAAQKKLITERIAGIIWLSIKPKPWKTARLLKKIWINFRWAEKDKRRDPDNLIVAKKFILDGMVLSGILKDDGWKYIAGFTDIWEVGEPGVWVEVKEV